MRRSLSSLSLALLLCLLPSALLQNSTVSPLALVSPWTTLSPNATKLPPAPPPAPFVDELTKWAFYNITDPPYVVARSTKIWFYATLAALSDIDMLPYQLDHALAMGVRRAHVLLNVYVHRNESAWRIEGRVPRDQVGAARSMTPAAKRDFALERIRVICATRGIFNVYSWSGANTAEEHARTQRAIFKRHVLPQDWVIHSKSDEFHRLPLPLEKFAAWLNYVDVDYVVGPVQDRIASNCRFENVLPYSRMYSIWDQFPCIANITGNITRAHNRKVVFYRGWIRTVGGNLRIDRPTQRSRRALEDFGYPRVPRRLVPEATDPFNTTAIVSHHFSFRMAPMAKLFARAMQLGARAGPGSSSSNARVDGQSLIEYMRKNSNADGTILNLRGCPCIGDGEGGPRVWGRGWRVVPFTPTLWS